MRSLLHAGANDRTDVGSPAILDDLTVFTYVCWVRPTAALTAGGLVAKGTSGSASRRSLEIRTASSNGLFGVVDCATTDANAEAYVLLTDVWQCVAMTYDDATKQIALFWGTEHVPIAEVSSYAARTTGVGSLGSNASLNQYLGCYGGATGGAGKYMGPVAILNRVPSVAALRDWQEALRSDLTLVASPGCVGLWKPGHEGTGLVLDRSGNGNHGTITGAVPRPLGPRPGMRLRRVLAVGWPAPQPVFPITVSISLSGGLTPAGTLARGITVGRTGGMTPAGALVRDAAVLRAGALVPAGSLMRSPLLRLAAGLTPSALITTLKVALITLVGAVAPAAAVVRTVGKTPAGSGIPNGDLQRGVSPALTGTLSPVGGTLRQLRQLLGGLLSPLASVATTLIPAGALRWALRAVVRLLPGIAASSRLAPGVDGTAELGPAVAGDATLRPDT